MILTDLKFIAVAILVVCSELVNCESFPNSIPRCKYGDVKCLENVINKVIKSSPGGIPEIELGSIDPLFIGKTAMEQGAPSSPVNIKVRMKNAVMTGSKNFVVNKVVGFEKDPKASKFEIYGFCPSVSITGSYQISGKALVVPVNGQGMANISLYDNNVKMEFITHTENRDDGEYLVIDNLFYNSNAKRMFLDFENLFNDPTISRNMNKFFNENQDVLYKELKPSMNAIFSNILKKRIQKVFKKFPYRELFID